MKTSLFVIALAFLIPFAQADTITVHNRTDRDVKAHHVLSSRDYSLPKNQSTQLTMGVGFFNIHGEDFDCPMLFATDGREYEFIYEQNDGYYEQINRIGAHGKKFSNRQKCSNKQLAQAATITVHNRTDRDVEVTADFQDYTLPKNQSITLKFDDIKKAQDFKISGRYILCIAKTVDGGVYEFTYEKLKENMPGVYKLNGVNCRC